jgi:hypothetical protein
LRPGLACGRILSRAVHGSLSGTAPDTYTPRCQPERCRLIYLQSNDGTVDSNVATIAHSGFNAVNDAPVLGPITAPLDPVQVNVAVSPGAGFNHPDEGDTHTATWDWGDGTSPSRTVNEESGSTLI